MKNPQYICFEGADGTYKTTTANAISDILESEGFKVLRTKEPGTPHIELTMKLRSLMLDNQYQPHMTKNARELISQAIRSIHMEKLVSPAIISCDYDYIIQDRGIISGMIYGAGCGIPDSDLHRLSTMILNDVKGFNWYDKVILLYRGSGANVDVAKNAKSEFESGDAMESQPTEFHKFIHDSFITYMNHDSSVSGIDVEKFDQVDLFEEVFKILRK